MKNGNSVDIAVCRDYPKEPGEWTMINDPEH